MKTPSMNDDIASPPDGAGSPAFARSLLDIAAEVEAAEADIRHELLRAANAGDCARVQAITALWLTTPPVDVVKQLGIPRHMPCFMLLT